MTGAWAVLSSAITIFLVLGVGSANAYRVKESEFIDWGYVVRVWTTMKTFDQGVAEWNRVVPVYDAWAKTHRVIDLEALDRDPRGALIKQGHDLRLLDTQWQELYSSKLHTLTPEPWNETTHGCGVISLMNIFTHQCNDLPDWRTANDRARDEKVLARRACQHEEVARAGALYQEYKASGGTQSEGSWRNWAFIKHIEAKCGG